MERMESRQMARLAPVVRSERAGALSAACGALVAFGTWYSDFCRRIRAYQELTRLPRGRLHAITRDPGAHDRMLAGAPPRKSRRDS